MATFKSVEVTAKDASIGAKYDARTRGAATEFATFTCTTVGTEAAADVIELCELPQNAQITGWDMQWEDLGTSTGDLGTTSGGQELAAGLALGTADDNYFIRGEADINGSNKTIYLEILTATADADKDIAGRIYYYIKP